MVSNLITTAFVQQYKDNVVSLYQQRGSKLRGTTRMESIKGEFHYFERLGPTAAVVRTVRHADTPLVNSQHSRRRVTSVEYEWADLVDQADKVALLIRPESEYAQNAAMAMGRTFDDEIITAFEATVETGKTGGTTVTFANDGTNDDDFTGAALTTANIMTLKTNFDTNDVDPEGRFIVISPEALNQLLVSTTAPAASNSDFNIIKAMVRGDINTWVGFTWIMSTRLPLATNTRTNYAWHRDSMGVVMGRDMNARISERADKSFSVQVYVSMNLGAVRIQGEGVNAWDIDETK